MDIGTPERYLQASWDILEGRVETEVAARLDGAGLLRRRRRRGRRRRSAAGVVAIGLGGRVAALGRRAGAARRLAVADGAEVADSVLLAELPRRRGRARARLDPRRRRGRSSAGVEAAHGRRDRARRSPRRR